MVFALSNETMFTLNVLSKFFVPLVNVIFTVAVLPETPSLAFIVNLFVEESNSTFSRYCSEPSSVTLKLYANKSWLAPAGEMELIKLLNSFVPPAIIEPD